MKHTFLILTLTTLFYTSAQNQNNCETYHEGYFQYKDKHDGVVILREKEFQIAYNTKDKSWIITKHKWDTECEYHFTFIKTNIKDLKEFEGETFAVTIKLNEDYGYHYTAIYEGADLKLTGNIIPIDNIPVKAEKIMRKKLKRTKKKFLNF